MIVSSELTVQCLAHVTAASLSWLGHRITACAMTINFALDCFQSCSFGGRGWYSMWYITIHVSCNSNQSLSYLKFDTVLYVAAGYVPKSREVQTVRTYTCAHSCAYVLYSDVHYCNGYTCTKKHHTSYTMALSNLRPDFICFFCVCKCLASNVTDDVCGVLGGSHTGANVIWHLTGCCLQQSP